MPKTPVQNLEAMPSDSARIQAVAQDLDKASGLYATVPGHELARLCGLDPYEPDHWWRGKFVWRANLEDYLGDPMHYIPYLNGVISDARYAELMTQTEAFEDGKRAPEPRLSTTERQRIEEAISQERADGCPDLEVRTVVLSAEGGTELEFEALVGDGGEVEELYGPYEIRSGKGINWDLLYEGDSGF